jgi:hypothetical protein
VDVSPLDLLQPRKLLEKARGQILEPNLIEIKPFFVALELDLEGIRT